MGSPSGERQKSEAVEEIITARAEMAFQVKLFIQKNFIKSDVHQHLGDIHYIFLEEKSGKAKGQKKLLIWTRAPVYPPYSLFQDFFMFDVEKQLPIILSISRLSRKVFYILSVSLKVFNLINELGKDSLEIITIFIKILFIPKNTWIHNFSLFRKWILIKMEL